MTTPMRLLVLAILLGILWWLSTIASGEAMLIGVLLGVLLGGLVVWRFRLFPARSRLNLLIDGKLGEYHAANDATLAKTRNPRVRAILQMNKAAAYSQSGEFARGVETQDAVDPDLLKGLTRDVYFVNLLYMLAHCDPDRARAVHEEHSELFGENAPKRIRAYAEDARRSFEVMVLGSDAGEAFFREKIETTAKVQRAYALYHLAVLLARRGEVEEAGRLYDEGREYWPALQVPRP